MAASILRSFTEASWMFGFRHRLALMEASRDYEGTLMMAKRMGYALLEGKDYERLRGKSSTLFILGSGESVQEVRTEQWEHIGKNASIGINSWVVHDFVPDAYSFEEVESQEYVEVSSTISDLLARPEILNQRPLILMLRPHSLTPADRIVSVPRVLAGEVRVYGRTTLFTRQIQNLAMDLEKLMKSFLGGALPAALSLDSGMSVSRLISLGARAGFQKIVLVGVDLNSPHYFFDVDPGYLERRNVKALNPWKYRGKVHDTEETTTRNFPASRFIPALSTAVQSLTGVQVYVSSASSALASSLPVFEWSDQDEIL